MGVFCDVRGGCGDMDVQVSVWREQHDGGGHQHDGADDHHHHDGGDHHHHHDDHKHKHKHNDDGGADDGSDNNHNDDDSSHDDGVGGDVRMGSERLRAIVHGGMRRRVQHGVTERTVDDGVDVVCVRTAWRQLLGLPGILSQRQRRSSVCGAELRFDLHLVRPVE